MLCLFPGYLKYFFLKYYFAKHITAPKIMMSAQKVREIH